MRENPCTVVFCALRTPEADILRETDMLPSVRTLSGTLRISALAAKKAYDKLEEAGFAVTVHGKGTYVTLANRALAAKARRKAVEIRLFIAIL